MISRDEAGAYLGKTIGNPKYPTYYFEKGRLTQKHDDLDNEGWHPIRAGERVVSMNIPDHVIDKLYELFKGLKSRSEVPPEFRIFTAGFYESDAPGSRLFEVCYNSKGHIASIHPSRTAMIKKGSGKNAKEDEEAAYKALETANYARNEMAFNPLTGGMVLQ